MRLYNYITRRFYNVELTRWRNHVDLKIKQAPAILVGCGVMHNKLNEGENDE